MRFIMRRNNDVELKIRNHKNSQAELKRLLKMVTPSSKAHKKYLNEAAIFINDHDSLFSQVKGFAKEQSIKRLKMLPSQIFNREFLVAYVDNDWFHAVAPNCDAVATDSLYSLNLYSPPLVIIPESKARKRNKNFLSIIEHEFIHVNQGIRGNFPAPNDFSKNPLSALMNYTLAEYQANFIQYCCFPESYLEVEKLGYSLTMQDWSVLRGYTQALEKLVLSIYLGQLPSPVVEKMLIELPMKLPSAFKQIGLKESYGQDYAIKLPPYLVLAIKGLLQNFPQKKEHEGFVSLTHWISANLDS